MQTVRHCDVLAISRETRHDKECSTTTTTTLKQNFMLEIAVDDDDDDDDDGDLHPSRSYSPRSLRSIATPARSSVILQKW